MKRAWRDELRQRILDAGGYKAVAKRIGVTRQALYRLTSKTSKQPSLPMMVDLHREVGTPMDFWAKAYPVKRSAA